MAGPTINPYRFGGQLGCRRDGANRDYVRERHLDAQRGRWLSPEPAPAAGAGANPYWYVGNNPATDADPDGHDEISERLKCKFDRVHTPPHDAYAIACSKRVVSKISASFTLPTCCNVPFPADFINFYLSMTPAEGGVSFKPQFQEWHMFLNPHPPLVHHINRNSVPIHVRAGHTVHMSLTRQPSGIGKLVVNGHSLYTPHRVPTNSARLVNASNYTNNNCRTAHSLAAWGNVSVAGGMKATAAANGGERIVSNLFSSTLGRATLPCDSRQFHRRAHRPR